MANTDSARDSGQSEAGMLGIYLNDHLAGATAGTELAHRTARSRPGNRAQSHRLCDARSRRRKAAWSQTGQPPPAGGSPCQPGAVSPTGKGVIMPTTTDAANRTARLLALMKKGDDAFNACDFATVDTVHHPDMVAYIPGLAEPVYGAKAHAAAIQQFLRVFPDMHVYSDPYPVQFGSGDWITVVTRSTCTFTGEMTLPDGTVIPRPGRRSTSSSARPPSGTATGSSSSPPSTTPRYRDSRSASPSSGGVGRTAMPRCREPADESPSGTRRPEPARQPLHGLLARHSPRRTGQPDGQQPLGRPCR
jgi:SnoaL-like polyketide cyclase